MVRGSFQEQGGQHVSLSALGETGKVVVQLMVQGGISRHRTTVDLSSWSFY